MSLNEHLFGFLQFYSSLMKEACMLQFLKSGYTSFKAVDMSQFKLTSYNSTHLKIEKRFKQNMQPTFLVSYKSFMNCVLMGHSQMVVINQSNNAFNRTDQVTELMFSEEVQSLLYVIVIMSVFTIIFAFILLLSYRFTRVKYLSKIGFLKMTIIYVKKKSSKNKKSNCLFN